MDERKYSASGSEDYYCHICIYLCSTPENQFFSYLSVRFGHEHFFQVVLKELKKKIGTEAFIRKIFQIWKLLRHCGNGIKFPNRILSISTYFYSAFNQTGFLVISIAFIYFQLFCVFLFSFQMKVKNEI